MPISDARALNVVDGLYEDLANEAYAGLDPEACGYIKTHRIAGGSLPTPVFCSGKGEWEIYKRTTALASTFDFCAILLRPRMWFSPRRDYVMAGHSRDLRSVEQAARVVCTGLLQSKLCLLPDVGYWVAYCFSIAAGAAAVAAVALSYPDTFRGLLLLASMLGGIGAGLLVALPLRSRVRRMLESSVHDRLAARLARDMPDEAETYSFGCEAVSRVSADEPAAVPANS